MPRIKKKLIYLAFSISISTFAPMKRNLNVRKVLLLVLMSAFCGFHQPANALITHPSAVPAYTISQPSGNAVKAKKDADKEAQKAAKEEAKKARNHEKYLKKQAKKKAQREKEQARQVARSQKEAEKMAKKLAAMKPQTVWIYGAGMNFLDSVVYVTDFQHLDSIYIEPDGEMRDYYAYTGNLKFYLESHYGLENETCAVFYMTDEKKATKRFSKMDAKLRKKGFIINRVSRDDFSFKRQDDNSQPQ